MITIYNCKKLLILTATLLMLADASAQPAFDGPSNLTTRGKISAVSGQTIENIDISNPDGPCIVIGPGVSNVIVQNSRIGPCGPKGMTDYGVFILDGATNITIRGNVIHDVGSGIKAYQAKNPIIVDKNSFYNIRGPLWNGQAIQFARVRGGEGKSRITCNISDANFGAGKKSYEDHISIYDSHGSRDEPIEIAYNRIRGGTSKTGGGITVGDKGGSWLWVHDNIVVTVANSGIGVAGGHDILVENNRVDNRGKDLASMTHVAYYVTPLSECNNITLRGNRGIARLWNWKEEKGETVSGYRHGQKRCDNVDDSRNLFGDTSLSESMFDEKPAACN